MNSEGISHHKTLVFYYTYMSVFQIIFLSVGFYILRKLIRELRQEFIDMYKVLQFCFILMFLISRNIFMLLIKVKNYEFFYISVLAISMFWFYFFENINNAWWVNVMLHLKALENPELMNLATLQKIKKKEKVILVTLTTVILAVMLSLLISIFVGLAFNCKRSDTDSSDSEARHIWVALTTTFTVLIDIAFAIGVLAMVSKAVIGCILLRMMKNLLNVPYKEVYFVFNLFLG